jgi:tRNA uridine 5-carboxymethylaminomethyl modification enzyme
VDDERWAAFSLKRERLERELQRLRSTWVRPATLPAADAERLLGKALEREYPLVDLLRRPGVGFDTVAEVARTAGHPALFHVKPCAPSLARPKPMR